MYKSNKPKFSPSAAIAMIESGMRVTEVANLFEKTPAVIWRVWYDHRSCLTPMQEKTKMLETYVRVSGG